ncbi:hypothetical protein [Enterobacter hormaechei]|uniref:hypothetical protein n=1 Tax=Enterobacterales TaxID=91347 RepID=UPI00388D015F
MNMLKQLVDQMVLEDGLKKAKPLAAQMGLESVPDEMLEMICPNLNYSGQFTPTLYARFQSVKRLLKQLSEQTLPKHGHIVKFTNQYGSYDESALLIKEGEVRNQNLIACVGGKTLNLGELCIFRDDLASDFGMSRPPISVSSGHLFRYRPASLFFLRFTVFGITVF